MRLVWCHSLHSMSNWLCSRWKKMLQFVFVILLIIVVINFVIVVAAVTPALSYFVDCSFIHSLWIVCSIIFCSFITSLFIYALTDFRLEVSFARPSRRHHTSCLPYRPSHHACTTIAIAVAVTIVLHEVDCSVVRSVRLLLLLSSCHHHHHCFLSSYFSCCHQCCCCRYCHHSGFVIFCPLYHHRLCRCCHCHIAQGWLLSCSTVFFDIPLGGSSHDHSVHMDTPTTAPPHRPLPQHVGNVSDK